MSFLQYYSLCLVRLGFIIFCRTLLIRANSSADFVILITRFAFRTATVQENFVLNKAKNTDLGGNAFQHNNIYTEEKVGLQAN